MTSGWDKDTARHSMAKKFGKAPPYRNKSKGISVVRGRTTTTGYGSPEPPVKTTKSKTGTIDFSGHYYSFKKENGSYKLSLGNWTDAGWHWDGDGTELGGYLYRLALSTTKQDFLTDAKKEGLKYSNIKADVIKAIEKGDGIYEASGDNRVWHFGEDLNDSQYYIDEFAEETGYSVDEIDPWQYYDGGNYDKFEKSPQYNEVKQELLEKFKDANTFEELFNNLNEEDFGITMTEATMDFQNQNFRVALNKWQKDNPDKPKKVK